jgi:hypothetical protein
MRSLELVMGGLSPDSPEFARLEPDFCVELMELRSCAELSSPQD